jgi:3-deoxy-D-arabino-heptulosonate 7-phosphate (DAHP) synthase class II
MKILSTLFIILAITVSCSTDNDLNCDCYQYKGSFFNGCEIDELRKEYDPDKSRKEFMDMLAPVQLKTFEHECN